MTTISRISPKVGKSFGLPDLLWRPLLLMNLYEEINGGEIPYRPSLQRMTMPPPPTFWGSGAGKEQLTVIHRSSRQQDLIFQNPEGRPKIMV